jgi:Fe-S-cluster containining protein
MADEPKPQVGDTAPCIGCGMCCNGTLYWLAKVTPGEEEIIQAHGLELTEAKEITYFKLPCHHEQCGSCTIYETRFDICRSFRCRLLRGYQAGEIDLGEARSRVETALALVETVRADDPAAAMAFHRKDIRANLAEAPDAETEQERTVRARKLLNIVALDSCLERWFRNPKETPAGGQPETSPSNS